MKESDITAGEGRGAQTGGDWQWATADGPEAPALYRIDARAITLRECWWGTRSPLALVAWVILKIAGDRVPCSTDDPPVESLGSFEVDEGVLPDPIRERFQTRAKELSALGFHSPLYHVIADARHRTDTYLATFAHRSMPIAARVHSRRWAVKTPPKEFDFVEFVTAFDDGSFLWSLSSKPDTLAPGSCRMIRRRGAGAADLFRRHEQALGADPSGRRRLPASTADHAADVWERHHEAVRDFHVQRGVFVPATAADHARDAAALQAHKQAADTGSAYPEVLVELDKIQRHKSGWGGAVVLLALSIALFLLIGLKGQTLLGVLALVPILLFHEAGHYLAMKAFGYRNLRMFLIPGFGAAVTGHHYNVPGWKQVIVALMGPMPGILLGIVIGIAGIAWDSKLALQAAFLTLIINGFNLIPILPFDGGRVVHTVLFARVFALDIVFRALAALAVVALGILLNSKVSIAIAVMMFIGLPQTIRVARVAGELRKARIAPVSPDSQTIPPAIADQIITRLKAGNPRPQHAKSLALQTLQVFETLNTRPPGWLASITSLAVQFLGFVLALAFATLFLLAQQGSLRDFFRSAVNRPQHALVVSEVRSSQAAPDGPADPVSSADPRPSRATIVATFANGEAAASAHADATGQLRGDERATLFGDSVLIAFPADDDAARKRWLAQLETSADDIFVESESLRAVFRFHMIARTPGDAEAIEAALNDYFNLPLSEPLVAPWSPSANLTPEQHLARKTYARLQAAETGVWTDPESARLNESMIRALKAGDQTEYKALAARQRELIASLVRDRLRAVAEAPPGTVDADLARRYLELHETLDPSAFYDAARTELAPRLGRVPAAGHGADDLTRAASGWCSRNGLVIEVEYVSFADASSGAPAFCAWLARRGITRLHYEATGEPEYSEEDEPPDELPPDPGPG